MSVVHPNRNGLWDRVLVDALAAGGVRRVVLCPGGRNGLLAMTVQRTPEIETILHVDERSAAFLAVGAILADGAPTAVCTTSGSAVANLLPAMAEAEARGLPLVLLTCDRPLAGRLPGEPQTLPQAALCAPLARVQLALPDPLDGTIGLVELQQRVVAALAEGFDGERPGPVHINIPQWGTYCATEDDPAGEAKLPPPPPIRTPRSPTSGPAEGIRAVGRSGGRPGARGLILAGADQPLSVEALTELLKVTRYPLIADIGSGLRHLDLPLMVTTADSLAEGGAPDLEQTEILIRLGAAPVSPGLLRALKRLRRPAITIARHNPGPDFLSPGAIGLLPPSPDALTAFADALGPGDSGWSDTWRTAEAVAAATRDIVLAAAGWGEMVAAGRICAAASSFAALHCANSLSVRHAGLLMAAGQGPPRLYTARGVNGTDGTLGLILGEAIAGGGSILALIGDQAFAHDLPALANPLWRHVRGALCVMNNQGAGLFDLTPARRIAGYDTVMRNPPVADFAGIAQAFSLVHRPCSNVVELDAALAETAQAEALLLIEIRVPPDTPAHDLPRLVEAMRASVRAAGSG